MYAGQVGKWNLVDLLSHHEVDGGAVEFSVVPVHFTSKCRVDTVEDS